VNPPLTKAIFGFGQARKSGTKGTGDVQENETSGERKLGRDVLTKESARKDVKERQAVN